MIVIISQPEYIFVILHWHECVYPFLIGDTVFRIYKRIKGFVFIYLHFAYTFGERIIGIQIETHSQTRHAHTHTRIDRQTTEQWRKKDITLDNKHQDNARTSSQIYFIFLCDSAFDPV